MRIGVVDIGTNSTRLLIADVNPASGAVTEVERRSEVTRLGQGVDASGRLADAAMERVFSTLEEYRARIAANAVDATTGVLTSAVRDAANGAEFVAAVRDRYQLDARVIGGDEEAQLTFLGAMSERDAGGTVPTVVIDVGGGSTELIIGRGRAAEWNISVEVGVVRQTERHVHSDPPRPQELRELADDVRELLADAVPAGERTRVKQAIAVAGTATSLAAIDQALDPYDPERVHGYVVSLATCRLLLARLAALPEAERRRVPGLHPARAPTIVAGAVVLVEALGWFGLDGFETSEHDILRGAALRRAGAG